MLRKIFLMCGVAASVLYVGTDVLAATRYGEYHSFTAQTISELMARGAPTERFVDPLFVIYGALMMAFALGVWMSSHSRRAHVTAGLLFAYGAVGLTGPVWFEMNMRGTAAPAGDIPHLVATSVLVLLILAAVAVGAAIQGRLFRRYSFATLLVLVAFGILVSVAGRGIATGQPTPWVGLAERIDIGAFLLWVAVLAVALLRVRRIAGAKPIGARGPGLPPSALPAR